MPMPTKYIDDPRLLAANENVAALELKGSVKAKKFVKGDLYQGCQPVSGIYRKPNGMLTCELLYGNDFRVLERVADWCFGQVIKDGYVGYTLADNLIPATDKTHYVCTLGTGRYQQGDMKSKFLKWLPHGTRLGVAGTEGRFARLASGQFVPANHLRKIGDWEGDFVSIAERYLDVPYLWGGNSPLGIDCSGLVSNALTHVGMESPRDSDQQFADLGILLDKSERPRRGDLVFWEGHVGIMVNEHMMVHATAFHMLVVVEPLKEVKSRIEASKEARFLGLKRLIQQA